VVHFLRHGVDSTTNLKAAQTWHIPLDAESSSTILETSTGSFVGRCRPCWRDAGFHKSSSPSQVCSSNATSSILLVVCGLSTCVRSVELTDVWPFITWHGRVCENIVLSHTYSNTRFLTIVQHKAREVRRRNRLSPTTMQHTLIGSPLPIECQKYKKTITYEK